MPKIIFEIRQTPTSVFNNEQESWICMFLVWQMVFWECNGHGFIYRGVVYHTHTCPGRPDDLANSFSKSSADLICPSCLLMILAQKTQHESRQVGNALRAPCLGEKADIHMEVVKRHLQVAKDGEGRDAQILFRREPAASLTWGSVCTRLALSSWLSLFRPETGQ